MHRCQVVGTAKLSMAGLGEKKIVFDKEGKWAHINEKLLQTFPKLKDGGGYEILRTDVSDCNTMSLKWLHCTLLKKYT